MSRGSDRVDGGAAVELGSVGKARESVDEVKALPQQTVLLAPDSPEYKLDLKACSAEIQALQKELDEVRRTAFDLSNCPLRDLAKAEKCDSCSEYRFPKVRTLSAHGAKVYALHWSRDGHHLVSAGIDGNLIIWNAHANVVRDFIALRRRWVMTCAFSPSGNLVASGGLDNQCSVFKLDLGRRKRAEEHSPNPHRVLVGHRGYISCCRWVNDTEIITSSGDLDCKLWDVETGVEKRTFQHMADVMSVAVGSEEALFASGSCDACVRVWDNRVPKCVREWTGHESDVNAVSWLPDGSAIGSACDDATCRLWDLRSYSQLNVFQRPDLFWGSTSISFSRTGRVLFAGGEDGYCRVWDTLRAETIADIPAFDSRTTCLEVNPDGKVFATGGWDYRTAGFVRVWAIRVPAKWDGVYVC